MVVRSQGTLSRGRDLEVEPPQWAAVEWHTGSTSKGRRRFAGMEKGVEGIYLVEERMLAFSGELEWAGRKEIGLVMCALCDHSTSTAIHCVHTLCLLLLPHCT